MNDNVYIFVTATCSSYYMSYSMCQSTDTKTQTKAAVMYMPLQDTASV